MNRKPIAELTEEELKQYREYRREYMKNYRKNHPEYIIREKRRRIERYREQLQQTAKGKDVTDE